MTLLIRKDTKMLNQKSNSEIKFWRGNSVFKSRGILA